MSTLTYPEGVCAHITVSNASAAIDFYCDAFGAHERFRLTDPQNGKIGHAELQFSDMVLMISDEYPDWGALAPAAVGGSPVKLHLRVPDVDPVFAKAIALGATQVRPLEDQFHGNRSASLTDPFGHTWIISSQIEDVAPDEMQRRWNNMMSNS